MNITIYTDGSCHNKTGHGGWGAIVFAPDGKQYEFSGAVVGTTNNQMEMLAVIRVLSLFRTDNPITLYSDSSYVVKGCNEYIQQWSLNNWQKAKDREIKNLSYWKRLKPLLDRLDVDIKWVKGHSGDYGNDQADRLAGEAMRNGREVSRL